ncbi:hypothetical protein D3C84_644620 [compost metagenome]
MLAAGYRRVVDQRRLLAAPLLNLVIQGQVATVQAPVGKPLMGTIGVFSKGFVGFVVPGQVIGLLGPEGGRIGDGMGVAVLIGHRFKP